MGHCLDTDIIFDCLRRNMGARAIARDPGANCVYVEAPGRVPMVHKLDAGRGTVHCYADVSTVLAGAGSGPVLALANQINIAIARDLGVPISAHVIDDRLHLSDIRAIEDGSAVHHLCAAQARDLSEIAGTLARELGRNAQRPGPEAHLMRL